MDLRFPADGWRCHVTWVGRWRLPQTVRTGLEIFRMQPPLLRWGLPLSCLSLKLALFFSLGSHSLQFSLGCECVLKLAGSSQHLRRYPVSPLCTRRVEEGAHPSVAHSRQKDEGRSSPLLAPFG